MLPTSIDCAARGRPGLQAATGGRWEQASSIALPAPAQELTRLLATEGEVAIEVMWAGPPVVFVGARDDVTSLAPAALSLCADEAWTPSRALEVLAGATPGAPLRAELGAVDAWRSVGPVTLALAADPAEVERALAAHPGLTGSGRPVALEVVHDAPREAWWAMQVGEGGGPVDASAVVQLLRAASRA